MYKGYILFLLCIVLTGLSLSGYGQVNAERIDNSQHKTAKRDNSARSNEILASSYFRNGEYEKAAALYASLYQAKNRYTYFSYYLQCLLALNRYDDAEQYVKAQLRRDRRNIQLKVDLGYVYSCAGKNKQSTKVYDRCINELTNNANQINILASAFSSKRLINYALEVYLAGRELSGNPSSYSFEIANIYLQQQRYEAMTQELLIYIKAFPEKESRAQMLLGIALKRDGELFYQPCKKILVKDVQKGEDHLIPLQLLYWLDIQLKDFESALSSAVAIDNRLQNGGRIVYDLAIMAKENSDFSVAIEAFELLIEEGENAPFYIVAWMGKINTRFLLITSEKSSSVEKLKALRQEFVTFLEQYELTVTTFPVVLYLAQLDAYYLNDQEGAIELLQEVLALPTLSPRDNALIKLELADIMVFNDHVWDAMLLYMQVDKAYKTDYLGHEAKFRLARLSYYVGEFSWAKGQLNVLKGATSKTIANDALELSMLIEDNLDADSATQGLSYYAKAELLLAQRDFTTAIAVLDSIPMLTFMHPLNDEVLYKKATIALLQDNVKVADSLFQRVVEEYASGILTDNALWQLGILHEEDGDTIGAKVYYKTLFVDYSHSIFAPQARNRFRLLRGEKNSDIIKTEEELLEIQDEK